MRKVIFTINDIVWMEKFYKLSEEQGNEIFGGLQPFEAIFTLYGYGKTIDRYTLTDCDGNKIRLVDLNGYQKGVILNDCYAYFYGEKYHSDTKEPFGVIDIQDMEKITEHTYGDSAFMKLKLNGKEYEITVYFRESGETYKTTADATAEREKVIATFNELY